MFKELTHFPVLDKITLLFFLSQETESGVMLYFDNYIIQQV